MYSLSGIRRGFGLTQAEDDPLYAPLKEDVETLLLMAQDNLKSPFVSSCSRASNAAIFVRSASQDAQNYLNSDTQFRDILQGYRDDLAKRITELRQAIENSKAQSKSAPSSGQTTSSSPQGAGVSSGSPSSSASSTSSQKSAPSKQAPDYGYVPKKPSGTQMTMGTPSEASMTPWYLAGAGVVAVAALVMLQRGK